MRQMDLQSAPPDPERGYDDLRNLSPEARIQQSIKVICLQSVDPVAGDVGSGCTIKLRFSYAFIRLPQSLPSVYRLATNAFGQER